MNARKNQLKYTEAALISFVWLVIFVTPILFREENNKPVWRTVVNQLEILVPLLALFLVNRFILVPRFLFRGNIRFYVLTLLGVIVLLSVCSHIYDISSVAAPPRRNQPAETRALPPQQDAPARRNPEKPPQPGKRQPRPVPPFANFLIFSFLVVGFDTGLRSGLRWIAAENEKVRLEKENVTNQLALLRTQISPHFFMNTLNNIHSLVDSNTEEAKEAIIKLSKMMRYLLYETESEMTTLKKEVEFIESFVNLMKLRFSERVKITLRLPASLPDVSIPPFLFTSFIENAFKHGISYQKESFVILDLVLGDDRLLFTVKNSRTEARHLKEFSGIGIENTRKRLNLLYGSRYHLDIIDSTELFTVNLSIPL